MSDGPRRRLGVFHGVFYGFSTTGDFSMVFFCGQCSFFFFKLQSFNGAVRMVAFNFREGNRTFEAKQSYPNSGSIDLEELIGFLRT